MILKEKTVNSSADAAALLGEIASMKNSGAIKIIKGSLLSDPMVDVEFKVKGTAELWSLRGVSDVHGGLILRRIN